MSNAKRTFLLIAIAAGVSIFLSAAVGAKPDLLSQYAGVGRRATAVGPDEISFTVVNRFEGTGPSGKFIQDGQTEWVADFEVPCPRTGDLSLRLIQNGAVLTYRDLSQLTIVSVDGEMCLNLWTFEFSGEIRGVIEGGSGRFEEATGSYVSRFEGREVVDQFNRVSGELVLDFVR